MRFADSDSAAALSRQSANSTSSAMRCSIDVGSLKKTGNEIFVKSLPIEPLRIAHSETGGLLSVVIGSLSLSSLYPSYWTRSTPAMKRSICSFRGASSAFCPPSGATTIEPASIAS